MIFPKASKPLSAALLALALPSCAAIEALTDASTPLEVYEVRDPSGITPRAGRPLPLEVVG